MGSVYMYGLNLESRMDYKNLLEGFSDVQHCYQSLAFTSEIWHQVAVVVMSSPFLKLVEYTGKNQGQPWNCPFLTLIKSERRKL